MHRGTQYRVGEGGIIQRVKMLKDEKSNKKEKKERGGRERERRKRGKTRKMGQTVCNKCPISQTFDTLHRVFWFIPQQQNCNY
jgi:hypothetical protein